MWQDRLALQKRAIFLMGGRPYGVGLQFDRETQRYVGIRWSEAGVHFDNGASLAFEGRIGQEMDGVWSFHLEPERDAEGVLIYRPPSSEARDAEQELRRQLEHESLEKWRERRHQHER